MDALKKAEQEKKEAAKRLKEAQEKSGEHYQLEGTFDRDSITEEKEESLDASVPDLEDDSVSSAPEKDSGEITDAHEESELLLTEDRDDEDSEPSLLPDLSAGSTVSEPVEWSLEQSADNTLQNAEISDDDNDFEDDISPGRREETFALTSLSLQEDSSSPDDKTAGHVIDDTRSETISDSRITKSVISAEALARDMGSGREVPTPVAAQTVFSAVARSSERRQFLEWMLFLGLVTIIIMATGAFYYLKVTPLTPETSSPLVAKGVEAGTDQPLDINIPEPVAKTSATGEINPAKSPAASSHEPAISTETTSAAIEETEMPASAMEETSSAVESGPVKAEMQPATTAKATAVEEDRAVAVAPSESTNAVTETLPQSLPENIPIEQAAIAISRSRSVSKQDQLVNSAYAAYTAGDYAGAETDYNQALESRPGNRDALLGLAAIAYRKGNAQTAFDYYLKLLKYFPKDTVATAAIINMQGDTDPVRSESTLKLLIEKNPNAAYLHFILGNVYAYSDRWADAQQSFFEAFRRQPQNADYVYNLAVSLDHLGQRQAARDYYQTALDLADRNQTSFNTAAVIRRISSLSVAPDKR